MSVMLLGELATHARGKTGGGVIQRVDASAQEWVAWARLPGRALVVVPPFERGEAALPTRWEARRVQPIAGGESALGKHLAAERQYELRGELMALERCAGQWVTGAWRQHPASGIIVITALPLWSLRVLEHSLELRAWFDEVLALAGKPMLEARPTSAVEASELSPADWTWLLHLVTGPFESVATALAGLSGSDLFVLGENAAKAAAERVAAAGLSRGGMLTVEGERALRSGPYGPEYRALRRMKRG